MIINYFVKYKRGRGIRQVCGNVMWMATSLFCFLFYRGEKLFSFMIYQSVSIELDPHPPITQEQKSSEVGSGAKMFVFQSD